MPGKLRFAPPSPPLQVVLVEPEIPLNAGSVARLCAATGSHLHLVGKLGFRLDAGMAKRAGVDYWDQVQVTPHEGFDAFASLVSPSEIILFSSNASRSHLAAPYRPGCALVFGRESTGLPVELLARHRERVHAIPTVDGIRSLNLANAVAIVVYEALRVLGALP